MDNSIIWKLIGKYFENNPQTLVRHHIDSYNEFFKNGIFQIFKEKNPLRIETRFDKSINEYRSQCIMYFGGKNGDKIYFGKPVIYDDNNSHYMYPNEARLRNMNYGMTIHYDIDIEFINILDKNETPDIVGGSGFDDILYEEEDGDNEMNAGADRQRKPKLKDLTPSQVALFREATENSMVDTNRQVFEKTLKNILLGKFPIMVQSDNCILSGIPKELRYNMGECRNDIGGYFIIGGKEKTVVPQEKFGDNMLYIKQHIKEDMEDETQVDYLYSAEIKSVSENVSKPRRTLSVRLMAPSSSYTNRNIVVNIPNVRKPVPLFIVFRALGILSDKEIISMCLLDLDKYKSMIDIFIPSVHDAGTIFTQAAAINYIGLLTKGKTDVYALEILADYLLPHVGEMNFKEKAYYLGHIVFKLLNVYSGNEDTTDRDNFKFKRIELVGSLMYDLFREFYTIQLRKIQKGFEEVVRFNKGTYGNNLVRLIRDKQKEIFQIRSVEKGFHNAFRGNWGSTAHTKRIGVVQDLNRLSFNSMLSHLRKTNLQLDASVKVVGPRVLHSSHWGFLDPVDTPDGGNIGLHKHLSLSTYVTQSYSRNILINWLRINVDMKLLDDCQPLFVSKLTKVFINGYWAGCVNEPIETVNKMKLFRRNALIPIYTSISFNIKHNIIYIYTDGGRVCRPIFYKDNNTNKFSFDNQKIIDKINDDTITWIELTTGFNKKNIDTFNPNNNILYELSELYNVDESNPAKLNNFLFNKAIIDYIDPSESEDTLIGMSVEDIDNKKYTHIEIHESLILGVMGNLVIFPENNPATRNSFSCVQCKQATSLYHTNYQLRMDKSSIVLDYGQTPLVKTRYFEHINNENVYGENVIVAVMCYTGYNVEDALLVNKGAIERGLFSTTYYTTYESHEESSSSGNDTVQHIFTNIVNNPSIINTNTDYDYTKLDNFGIIKENTPINKETVLIGLTSRNSKDYNNTQQDMSTKTKKGQSGVVDKSFITDGDEGNRIAKVRIREQRSPCIGDKLGSRAGQKGTVGVIIDEVDMPYTKSGIRPDIIINPHAIPSRMTIGQFVETLTGKACSMYGSIGDCTAFNNKGSKIGYFGNLLSKVGFHSSGNEIMYNGMTGEQLDSEIFMGPNYYMRLKQMVKDKINARHTGKNNYLTKQPVSGRAQGGGLRIGEMERDSIISHGTSEFLRESMMERSDSYFVSVCNKTGMLAIYNPTNDLFISPMADGPVKYNNNIDTNNEKIQQITKYGRSFSVINVPYSFKLLIQELQAMNVQMRIITEDNINQIENLSFSNNINKLLFNDEPNLTNIIQPKIIDGLNKDKTYLDTPENQYISNSTQYDSIADDSSYSINNEEKLSMESPPMAPDSPYEMNDDDIKQNKEWFDQNSELYKSIYGDNTDYKISGGGHNNDYEESEEYEVGDIVKYRGDNNNKRLWSIKSIGNKVMTIETETSDGLNPGESSKIVTELDIYKADNIHFEHNLTELSDNNYIEDIDNIDNIDNNQIINQTGGVKINNDNNENNNDSTPTIHFAPVIINGDNSQIPEQLTMQNPIQIPTQVSQEENSFVKVNDDSNNIEQLNTDIDNNDFFKNLKIKKTG